MYTELPILNSFLYLQNNAIHVLNYEKQCNYPTNNRVISSPLCKVGQKSTPITTEMYMYTELVNIQLHNMANFSKSPINSLHFTQLNKVKNCLCKNHKQFAITN